MINTIRSLFCVLFRAQLFLCFNFPWFIFRYADDQRTAEMIATFVAQVNKKWEKNKNVDVDFIICAVSSSFFIVFFHNYCFTSLLCFGRGFFQFVFSFTFLRPNRFECNSNSSASWGTIDSRLSRFTTSACDIYSRSNIFTFCFAFFFFSPLSERSNEKIESESFAFSCNSLSFWSALWLLWLQSIDRIATRGSRIRLFKKMSQKNLS